MAFRNIIRNAFQATGMDSNLKVRVNLEGNSVILEFIDQGPGIADKDLSHIFDLFYTTKEKTGGTGEGLALAVRIIQEHGGTISARNNENGSSKLISASRISFLRTALSPEISGSLGIG